MEKNRIAGVYDAKKKVFFKRVRTSRHLFVRRPAWGFSADVIKALESRGCLEVVLFEQDNREKWCVDFGILDSKAWRNQFPGYENQRFLDVDWWTIYDEDNKLVQEGERLSRPQLIKQKSLF